MKLSIIIPYYNGGPYTKELLDRLAPQVTSEVETIIVDDGSTTPFETDYDWVKVIRKKNGGCASARNKGLKVAKGEYIQFIDADDMVPEYFIEKLLSKIEGGYDVIDYSWKSLTSQGNQHNYILRSDNDRLPNPSVCTRCFKKAYIGSIRFNELKDSTEDEDFSRRLGYILKDAEYKHGSVPEYMYFYRTANDNSKVHRFKKGLMKTKRIVYYYSHVTADMTDLLAEIKHEDEQNEVWLLTNQNDIPELSHYCQISAPMKIWGHELRGEHYNKCEVISPPLTWQVIIYCEHCATVGGISTVIYNFCHYMRKYYDILVLYGQMDPMQIAKLSEIVQVEKMDPGKSYQCDTLILNRLTDKIGKNISYKKSIQMCHACRQINYRIPKDRDFLVNVSQAAKESWGEESENGIVIHNMALVKPEKCLILVSATRVNTIDKGQNDQRMRKLAEMLEKANVKFVWLNFADGHLRDMPKSFINMPAMENIHPYIEKADYLVQLSDAEAYSMSILEALCLNTAVIATPFPSLYEEGFIDGETGYEVPYDMNFDVTKLLNVPKFDFNYDNEAIIKQWRGILGNTNPKQEYNPDKKVKIRCTRKYCDIEIGREIAVGEEITVNEQRASQICGAGYGRRV